MGKFNIGDIVIGNELANRYTTTSEGVKCVVIGIGDGHSIKVMVLQGKQKGAEYYVNADCFDLLLEEPQPEMPQIINMNKENNMKILEIYKKRKLNKLFIEYENKIKEIESFDSIQSLIKDTEEQLNALLGREDNDKITISINNLHGTALHDDITQVKIDEAAFNYKNEQDKVYNLIEEVSALLEMTSDYDEQVKILKKYGILNKEGKLNV